MHTREIVDWFQDAYESPTPEPVGQKIEYLLLDYVGNSLLGATSELGTDVVGYLGSFGAAGNSQILGAEFRSAPSVAAYANAVLASAFDFDEGYHIAGYSLSAGLAVGQAESKSGAEVLQAIGAGYELGECLRLAADADRHEGGGITNAGWYHVGIVGPIVTSMITGILLGLDKDQLASAIGIAANSCGGIRSNFGAGAKQLQGGLASRAGVEAAYLAKHGVTGYDNAIMGALGIEATFGAGSTWDWNRFREWSWQTGALSKDLAIRKYPACAPAQPAIEAVLRLRERVGFAPEEIVKIVAEPRPFSLRTPDARNESELGFSLPYLLSLAAVDGCIGVDQLRVGNSKRPEVRRVMTTLAAPPGEPGANKTDLLTIELANGDVLEAREIEMQYLTSSEKIRAKFQRAAADTVGESVGASIEEWVSSLRDATTVTVIPERRK
jgi:2-methylcitrate dehydratase PrpD